MGCSNGRNTAQLKVGEVNVNTPDIPDLVSVSNVSTISEYIAPITDGRTLWKLITHLTDTKEHAANRKRIESLQSMQVTPTEKLLRGYLVRGRHIAMDVDGSGFASSGDLYLFGELMFYLLDQFTDLNSFLTLSLTNVNNGETMQWQSK